jgi:glucosylglycerate synthase
MEVGSNPQPTPDKAGQVESADLVVGILADLDQGSVVMLCDGLRALPGSPRVVVVQSDPAHNATAPNPQAAPDNSSLSLLSWSAIGSARSPASMQSVPEACETLFATGEKLGAKACCLVSSRMESVTPQWICEFVLPLLEADLDLVVPYYTPSKLHGLLNSSIVYPLTRCLYGKQIHNPLGPDVGVSRRLAQRILRTNRGARTGTNRTHPLASLVPMAVCENLQICQVRVGARVYPPTNWMNVSSLLSQVLGPIFLDMERTAACWQRTRGSVSVPARGERLSASQETATLDLNHMVETFQLGVRDLHEIWSLVLPPATLFELRKLSRLPPEQVDMPDDLWARIVYDFALAHRLRTINPDHLLGSMTPLYLAWVSSYARGVETAGAATVEERIERLSLAYEANKPYLVSRWRWPDRFNP